MASNVAIENAMNQAYEHHQAGRLPQAEALYRQILATQPNHAVALHGLGFLAYQVGQPQIAADLISRAISLDPSRPHWHSNLAAAFIALGQYDRAIAACRACLLIKPDHSEAHNNMGFALQKLGQYRQAADAYRVAVHFRPDNAEAFNNLGNALQLSGQLDQALNAYQDALRIRAEYADVYNNLGGLYKWRGELDQAMASYQKTVDLAPDDPVPHSNLVYTMHFCPGVDAIAIHQAHRNWNQRHADKCRASIRPHDHNRNPDRRLRIGYVSPDFREHPVGRFLLPLLQNHDHGLFEIVCFSDVAAPNVMTQQFRDVADAWHEVVSQTDEQLAGFIRQQRIDILVDLTMHMEFNRLLVFARKPAPVQATYLAYCSTTGLDTIDYRLSDPHLDPPDTDEKLYTEQTVRLPQSYWCYQALPDLPEPGKPPVWDNGYITFGCLNNFCKVTVPTLQTWCRLMRQLPASALVLYSHDGTHRSGLADFFASQEVDPQRIRFVGFTPLSDYPRLYHGIDIALDPFPYNGGTTSCDALWMGVPVVSLAGKIPVGRAGLSLLSNIGLPELVGFSEDQYIQIATELAHDLDRLSHLRATLRQRMQSSPLMDAPSFARNMESAYRQMWRTWCGH